MTSSRAGTLALLISAAALAAPPSRDALPEQLRSWADWALHGEGTSQCPFLRGDADARHCAWPARLELALDEKGGRFSQSWRVDLEGCLPLPGDSVRWPQEVRADGAAAVVVATGNTPCVALGRGEHTVTGAFLWDAMPESLAIPPETGLLALSVRGKPVAQPNRDASGRVFLQKDPAQSTEAERIEIRVHRRVVDEIPLQVVTHLELAVSGKSREVILGRALLDGFVPMELSQRLPARVEPDGRLRVQVRRGSWTIDLTARHDGPVTRLTRPQPNGQWAEGEEYWVFDARNELRQVQVGGVPAVDPQQTTLPQQWRHLPAYAVKLGDVLALDEQRRGDADPLPDQLELKRELWLDFDGRGYTVKDHITGALNRSWRLEMTPPTQLGHVAALGSEQVITRVADAPNVGIEMRQGRANLIADSRIEGSLRDIPAVSWDADFQKVSARLRLPPGWSALGISGPDDAPDTWIHRWSLLDLFLVMVIAAAVGKLFGWGWGALALVALGLTFPEEGSPQWVWLAVLAIEPLVRLLPAGWVRTAARVLRLGTWIVLALVSLSFIVDHVRAGLYPALERPYSQMGGVQSAAQYSADNLALIVGSASTAEAPPPPAHRGLEDQGVEMDGELDVPSQAATNLRQFAQSLEENEPARAKTKSNRQRAYSVQEYDKNVTVQTGPGLPRWDWSTVNLSWSGPVARSQRVHLVLLSPGVNLFLAFLRAALIAILVLRVLGFRGAQWPDSWTWLRRLTAPAASALLLLAAGTGSPARAQEIPSDELLRQLRERLLERPACVPDCAASPRMILEVTAGTLRARMEISAAASTAVPLPGSAQQWVPDRVLLDGRPAAGLLRTGDGKLWIALAPGNHQVVLEGALPARDTVQLSLPLRPHRVDAAVSGWTLDGLHEDGVADNDLQLSRGAQASPDEAVALQQTSLPPFVRVQRTLLLGLGWEVETKVERMTPPGAAVMLEVPLLPGESVTSDEVRVEGHKALVNMGPQLTEVSWKSVLDQRPTLQLEAPKGVAWTEVWRLDASPVWHVTLGGIPVVHYLDATGDRVPEWRPWPGEKVEISVTRPTGIAGQTMTIDESLLQVSPGSRATDATLTFNLRASRGGQHVVTLPPDAQLQSVQINGTSVPIRQEGRTVALPLVPGSQSVALGWRQSNGISTSWRTPAVKIGAASVNADVQVDVPQSRWVLLLWGPRMGPAVLFWAVLLVLVVVAIGLARLKLAPLRAYEWILLAVGLSQVPIVAGAIVAGWLLALGVRQRAPDAKPLWFDLRQIALVGWALVAAGVLVAAIHEGLLGTPDMQISGNGSSYGVLRWFDDRTTDELPRAWVLSIPMFWYRAAMLAWAVWLALALLRWLKWAWAAFSTGGLWKRLSAQAPAAQQPAPPPAQAA